MNRRANIVEKPGQRELGGADATSDAIGAFEQSDRAALARQHNRGGEPIRSGANYRGARFR
jgi:hypothetical protein